jgi:hypothetical protein
MIDAQFRFNQCNSFREENISVFSHMVGKCSNAFSENTNMIKAKLYIDVYWMVFYKLHVFVSEDLPMIIPGQFG